MSSARNLGSWLDSKLSMAIHILKTCCLLVFVESETLRLWFMLLFLVELIIATAFYMVCQSINSTSYNARLICNETKYCEITPLLVDLH